jgi:hypothetical protein
VGEAVGLKSIGETTGKGANINDGLALGVREGVTLGLSLGI